MANDKSTPVEQPVDLARRIAAEAIGTCFLVAIIVGAGIMATNLTDDIAVALFGLSLPTGAMVVALVLMFGPISGAHFNPIVTLSLFLQQKITPRAALAYIITQVVFAILGTVAAHVIFEQPLITLSQNERYGGGIWFGEFLHTFFLIGLLLCCSKHAPGAIPYSVGLYVFAGFWTSSSQTFANPAVSIARSLSDTFAGIRPIDLPIYIFFEIVGSLGATVIFLWLLGEPQISLSFDEPQNNPKQRLVDDDLDSDDLESGKRLKELPPSTELSKLSKISKRSSKRSGRKKAGNPESIKNSSDEENHYETDTQSLVSDEEQHRVVARVVAS